MTVRHLRHHVTAIRKSDVPGAPGVHRVECGAWVPDGEIAHQHEQVTCLRCRRAETARVWNHSYGPNRGQRVTPDWRVR